MRLKKLDSLLNDYQKKNNKAPAMILINSEDAEKLRMDLVKANNLESESPIESYKGARIIRSNDIYPGEVKLI
jgi:hypothetical protein